MQTLGEARFEMPGPAEKQLIPPKSEVLFYQNDTFGQFFALRAPMPDDMAAHVEQNEQNLQGVYGWMNDEINQFFGFDEQTVEITESAEAQIDGVPARATLGRIKQPGPDKPLTFEYRFAFVQKQSYVFAYFELPLLPALAKNDPYPRTASAEAKKRFFKSIQLPELSDRQKANRQAEKQREEKRNKKPLKVPMNVLVMLAVLLLAAGILFWSYRSGRRVE